MLQSFCSLWLFFIPETFMDKYRNFVCLHDCPKLNCLLPTLCQDDTALGVVCVCAPSLVGIGCGLVASTTVMLGFI